MISNNSLPRAKRCGKGVLGDYGWIFVLLTWIVWGFGYSQAGGATADFNNDGIVDFPDLVVFISQWLQNDPNINDGSYCVSNFNQDGIVDFADFAVFAVQWQPGRMVTISGMTGVGGVTMNGLPGNPISDSSGFYSAIVPYGWGGTIMPTRGGYSFSPESVSYTFITADLPDRNFSVTQVITFTISGTTGMGGVTLNGLPGNPVSDSNGYYIAVVPYGWAGTIMPTKTGYSFSPSSISYTLVTSDLSDRNFIATQVADVTISGTTGVGGVIMDGLPGTPVSDSHGDYFGVVPFGWNGTVVPTKAGHRFSPENLSYSFVTSDLPNQNFLVTQVITFIISGTTGTTGVIMNGLPGNPVSDSSGFYSAVVPYDWSGTVIPKKPGYSFSPENMSYTLVASDLSGQNFTATQLPSVMVAASDAPEWFKAESNFLCDGTDDQEEINAALGNDRRVVLSSGTFNVTGAVTINYNNIVLDGQGVSTILKNRNSARYCVIYQFGANHDIAIRNLQIDNNDYGDAADAWNKCLFINGNYTTVIGSDHNKYFCLKAHTANSDNRPVTGPNFTTYWARVNGTGARETWAEGQSYTGIDSCNNILIEGVTAHDSRAEVICVDYAEYITIRNCDTYNGAWSGITVAHTQHSSIYNNNVEHCGELPKAGYQMARGINSIGSVDVSIYNNWIRDCMCGGIGVNETFGIVESDNINIYDNHIINTIGAAGGIVVESSDHGSYSTNVNIYDNYINTDRHAKLDAGGAVIDNGDGTVTLPAAYNGYRTGLSVKIEGTASYNGTFTLQNGTDDNHIVISHVYVEELFDGTETVSQATIGIWFEYVKNFNIHNNIVVPGAVNTGTYWCYVTVTAFDGLVQYNTYTPSKTYINKGISVIFNGNVPIAP